MAGADVQRWPDTARPPVPPMMHAFSDFKRVRVHPGRGAVRFRLIVSTEWTDRDAVRRFAGDTLEKGVMPDILRPFFPDDDAVVSLHDEIFQEATP